jgi:hypothetical protein
MHKIAFVLLSTLMLPALADTNSLCNDYPRTLRVMAEVDQALRDRWDYSVIPPTTKSPSELPAIVQQTMLIDRENTKRLRKLMARCGWPRRGVHGSQALSDAWLLAQHADKDSELQRIVLANIQKAVDAGEAPVDQLAYYSDRTATLQGKPQLYGTQLTLNKSCELEFLPFDDVGKVEERRRKIGWSTLEEYKKSVAQHHTGASCAAAK